MFEGTKVVMGSKEERDFKSSVLGMPIATANSRLRKILLYHFAKLAKAHNCYRCSLPIESIEEFSIEHKQAWLHHPNAKQLFFDIENISFSHRICNSSAVKTYNLKGIHPNKGKEIPERRRSIIDGKLWCNSGTHFQVVELFAVDNKTSSGFKSICNPCRSVWRKQHYKEGKSR